MWVRGLKHSVAIRHFQLIMSHPVWVRGLKLGEGLYTSGDLSVAPRVGAWIETYAKHVALGLDFVAPRVGAWIETGPTIISATGNRMSHPVWVRGLKHFDRSGSRGLEPSHPVWVRGLKHL